MFQNIFERQSVCFFKPQNPTYYQLSFCCFSNNCKGVLARHPYLLSCGTEYTAIPTRPSALFHMKHSAEGMFPTNPLELCHSSGGQREGRTRTLTPCCSSSLT